MRKLILILLLAVLPSLLIASVASAAPRLYSEHIYLDLGPALWPSTSEPSIYGGYIDLYFPFDKEMALFVWFKGFYEGQTAPIEAISEVGLQIAFNPYLAFYFGAVYGFNNDYFLAVDPVVGLLGRLPLGKSVNTYLKTGVSYYFDPFGISLNNFTIHYGLFMTVDTAGILSFNLGGYGYYSPRFGFLVPAIQAGVGFRLQ